MKTERGRCYKCGQKTAVRDGEADDGRPRYRCLNGSCEDSWTKGYQGEPWDTKPASTRWSGLCSTGKHGLDFEGQACDLCARKEGAR